MRGFHLPPAFPYFLGALLVVLGALRAYHLGWKRRELSTRAEEAVEGGDARPARAAHEKRHLVWGVMWMAMGLFLIVSTLLDMRGS